MHASLRTTILAAARAIKAAPAIAITAGAGIGVDSGLPDFRGDEGFWRAYPPLKRLGLSFVDMASPRWFFENPRLAWGFYGHRLALYRSTKPHRGFEILKSIATSKQHDGGYFVFTSNVDGQFQKAGFPEDRIVECHGSIHYLQCALPCSRGELAPAPASLDLAVDPETFQADPSKFPKCPQGCSSIARPNILMFNDSDWTRTRTAAQSDRLVDWYSSLVATQTPCVVIEVGAGTSVPTVRYQSELLSRVPGSYIVRINAREPQIPHNRKGFELPMSALEALTELEAALPHA